MIQDELLLGYGFWKSGWSLSTITQSPFVSSEICNLLRRFSNFLFFAATRLRERDSLRMSGSATKRIELPLKYTFGSFDIFPTVDVRITSDKDKLMVSSAWSNKPRQISPFFNFKRNLERKWTAVNTDGGDRSQKKNALTSTVIFIPSAS